MALKQHLHLRQPHQLSSSGIALGNLTEQIQSIDEDGIVQCPEAKIVQDLFTKEGDDLQFVGDSNIRTQVFVYGGGGLRLNRK